MTIRRDPDVVIAAWLRGEAQAGAPDRLLSATRAQLELTHQRRSWWPAWRSNRMNTYAKLIAAAAAVLLVAVVGYQVLPGNGGIGGQPTIAPSPVSTASAKWAEFSDHVEDSANEISAIIAEAERVRPSDADGLLHSWQKIRYWAGSEAVWLDAHPSDACYAGTYTLWSKVVTRVDEGFLPKFTQFIAEIKAEMKKAMDSIPTSAAACGT